MTFIIGSRRGMRAPGRPLNLAAVVASAALAAGPSPVTGGPGLAPEPLHPIATPTWSSRAAASPGGSADGSLQGVSCVSAGACMAVGSYQDGGVLTLAEWWDGTGWTVERTPDPTDAAGLQGVSCTSASFCMAVGSYRNGPVVTLAERWNGTAWAATYVPDPAGISGDGLQAVSCTSPSACTAVGYYSNGAGSAIFPLAERWNGTSWGIEPVPAPGGTADGELDGVSCAAAAACTAVGYSLATGGAVLTLAERWDGTSWAAQSMPAVAGDSYLTSVSCATASACTAVGYSRSGQQPAALPALAEQWNGTSWSVQAPPDPSADSYLDGVSCTAPGACTAVGGYLNGSSNSVPLAEQWNGDTWVTQAMSGPAGASANGLQEVSCPPGAGSCVAVGYYNTPSDAVHPLAEIESG